MAPDISVVPGEKYGDAYAVLEDMAGASKSMRGAVAFVTSTGVDLLEATIAKHPDLELQLVVRGAPITEPSALTRLVDMGVEVSALVGPDARRFHPKLWLGEADGELLVLAGSGNLTEGGLRANDEQFEYLRLSAHDHELIEAHEGRFNAFAELAVPVSDLQGTAFWAEWEKQAAAREALADEERKLTDKLVATAGASLAHDQLYVDLHAIYDTAKAEVRIPAPRGGDRPYVASRFKQAIDRGKRNGMLVPVVAGIVRSRTEGFAHLAEAGRPDLMVETLVLDGNRPYHNLFSATTKEHARRNLDQYNAERPGQLS